MKLSQKEAKKNKSDRKKIMSLTYDDFLEKITAPTLVTENWEGILNLCDKIGVDPDGGKAALKAMRKRLNNRDPHVVLMALSVLDSCWSNCGIKFRREVSSGNFISELKALCTNSQRQIGLKSRQTVLKWAESECAKDPSLSLIPSLVRQLKEDGHSFAVEDPKKPSAAVAKYANDPDYVSTQQEEEEIAKAIADSLAEAEKHEKSRNSAIYPSAKSASSMKIATSTPSTERKVRALYDFEAAEGNELSFVAGDVITITDDSNPHWWTGRIGVQQGLFPSSFVTNELMEKNDPQKEVRGQKQQTIVPSINEAILSRCLHMLNDCDPTGERPDPPELAQLEAASYAQASLIDAHLANIDRQSNALAQIDIAIRDVLALYDTSISAYPAQPPMYQPSPQQQPLPQQAPQQQQPGAYPMHHPQQHPAQPQPQYAQYQPIPPQAQVQPQHHNQAYPYGQPDQVQSPQQYSAGYAPAPAPQWNPAFAQNSALHGQAPQQQPQTINQPY